MKNNRQLITIDTLKINEIFIDKISPEVLPLETETKLPKILEENVGNFCPICGKTIFSNLLEINGKVYLEKNCCKKELVFMENDVDFFLKYKNNTTITPPVPDAKNYKEAMFKKPNHGLSAVSLYITTRCNMNCPICYLKFNNCFSRKNTDMSIKEMKKRVEKFHSQVIYIYGGEPTLREDFPEIIKTIKNSGNIPYPVTNGLKLENRDYVRELKRAGLEFIALQFDGFDRTANIRLRGQDYLERRLRILENIKEVGGFCVHLGCVIEKGFNEAEVSNIIRFALKKGFINRICFVGLTPPGNEHKTPTTRSDLIKIMEREGYFDREYFLELVKMYQNIYETAVKIFNRSPLENWIFKRIPGFFCVVRFRKNAGSLQLLFQKSEIENINQILTKVRNKKSKAASFFELLRNFRKLAKTPLTTLAKEKLFKSTSKSMSNGMFEISFRKVKGPRNELLNTERGKLIMATGMLFEELLTT